METFKKGTKVTEKDSEKDKCVLCGCDSPYEKNEHIDYRFCYVEGAGQLCKECWNKCYLPSISG